MLSLFRRALSAAPTLKEARSERPPAADADLSAHRVVWGPIRRNDSLAVGALAPAYTVVLQPMVAKELREAVLKEVPSHVLPRTDDTPETLRQRLASSTFLEDSHVLKGGCGPLRVRLNATCMSQPRRRSWSVEVEGEHEDADGDKVITLLNYTAHGRLPADWRARVMPRPVYDLGVILWRAAYPLLTPISQQCRTQASHESCTAIP